MSKSEGKKIAIRFSDRVMGNLEILPKLPFIVGKFINLFGFYAASSTYSVSYPPSNAFDGSTSSMWYTRTSGEQWIQVSTVRPIRLGGFRWYLGSSYRPKDFKVQGSDDGVNWTDLFTGASEDTQGWKEYYWQYADAYLYHRWTVTTRYSSYLYLYEIEAFVHDEKALKVTGLQRDYVGGELKEVDYAIKKIEHHPIEENTLLITLHDNYQEAFDEVEGAVTIQYKGQLGNLIGYGGAVEDFTVGFYPTDLISSPNPGIEERLTVGVNTRAVLIPVTYHNIYDLSERIRVVGLTITTQLIYSSIENP